MRIIYSEMNSRKTCCLKCHRCCETLVCSIQGCPIVIHESCMPCAAHFDNTGNFYCPYCLFKQSLVECHQAKEKVLLAKKALVGFLDTRAKNDTLHLQNSNTLKRKRPEAPTLVQKRNDAGYLEVDCNNAHQPMQVEDGQQNDNQFPKTPSDNQQQAGQKKGHCLVKGFAAKDDRDLTKSCPVSVEVEAYKIERQEDVQTQDGLRIEDRKKEIQGKTVNKGGCSRIAYENMFKVKSPKIDVFPSREETTKTMEGYYNNGVDKEPMQTDPLETSWCMKNKDALEISKESDMGNAFQDCTEKIDEGERKANHVVHHMRNDEKSFTCGNSEQLSIKDPEIEQALEKFHSKAMEMLLTHEEPKKISVFCEREDTANVVTDKPDEIKDSAYQDECSINGQGMVDLNITIFMAKQNSTAVTKEPDKIKDSGSQDDYIRRNERVEIPRNANQPDDIRKNCYGSAKGITQRNTLQDPVHPTKDESVPATHKLENLTKQQPVTKNELERSHKGVAQNEKTELRSTRYDDKQETVEQLDAENSNSFQDEGFVNCKIVMGRKDVDQTAGIGEDCCGSRRTIEEKTWVKFVKNAPEDTRNESATVSYEVLGSVDDSESCTKNSEYLAYGSRAVEKRQMKKKLKNGVHLQESSVCSENEVEEFEISTLDKPRHKVKSIKQIQWSTILPAARRKKLPWTAQEIEMLKEGVQKFSMTTNKNLPWLKILEFGCHIFDGTRTPVDLKDKWKNMKGKGNTHSQAK